MPDRVQQSRATGWRKPENTVSVTRPGKFGNPFAAKIRRGEEGQATIMCFCPLDQPCHADALLEIANA